ncbi:hypothetical protein SLA2020_320880 [Shorea laevis]
MGTKSRDSDSLWSWKGNIRKKEGKQFPVSEFFLENRRQREDIVLGPGVGAGVGCGAGVGFALVGGIGYGGWPWNHLKLAFGIGAGCGIGVGFGYGQGIGYGLSLDSLKSHLSKRTSDSDKRRIIVAI